MAKPKSDTPVFPSLYTERLLLRKIIVDDIPCLLKYGNNPKISAYILNIPYPYQEPDAVMRISYVHQGVIAGTRYVFSITLNETEELIGEISLHLDDERKKAQLGYWIGEPLWNKGLATEAIHSILLFAFNKLGLDMVFAGCKAENIASVRVLEKNNFKQAHITGSLLQYVISNRTFRSILH